MDIITLILTGLAVILLVINLFIKKKDSADGISAKVEAEARDIKSTITGANSAIFQGVQATNEQILQRVRELGAANAEKISEMRAELDKSLSEIRYDLRNSLKDVREDNSKQLESIRQAVDEKLSATLNERLTQSFNIISERLEAVSKGLGEMQSLTGGVSDLKRMLTNVKSRGTWGEVSLEAILEDILTPEQYEKNCNVSLRGDKERVDFAVILPGADEQKIYLPIDVKFPIEDYQRLFDAAEEGNRDAYQQNLAKLIVRVKTEARSIREKYIKPPKTTDFAVMYFPVEGLYAEILKQNGLVEELQNNFKIIPAGPVNISAMLNTLRMGFKTLAIQKYSKEIFDILSGFRKEFEAFSALVAQTQGQLNTAAKTLEKAGKKTDVISKKLSKIDKIAMTEEDAALLAAASDED